MGDPKADLEAAMADLDFADLDAELLIGTDDEDDATHERRNIDELRELNAMKRGEISAGFVDPDERSHAPKELDDIDLGAYDVIDVGGYADSTGYVQQFMANVRKPYEETGRGDYECILRWSHSRVDSEDVERFIKTVRSRFSYMRAKIPVERRDFVVCKLDYLILSDRRHVVLNMSRMTSALYSEYRAQQHAERQGTSTIDELAKLL